MLFLCTSCIIIFPSSSFLSSICFSKWKHSHINQDKANNSPQTEENKVDKDKKDTTEQAQTLNLKENQNEINPIKVEVKNNGELQNTEDRLSKSNTIKQESAKIEFQLNENNIYQLPQETISKLNISPCITCQSQNFLIYIPDPSPSPENAKEPIESEEKKPSEMDEIKSSKNQNILLPILLCEQKHQFCLICHQIPHINSFCSSEYMNSNNIVSLFDIVKESVPEEKKDIFNAVYSSALNYCQKSYSSESCCTCKCTWSIIFLIFGLILWTCGSVALVALGLAMIALSLALRLLCCIYHLCYQACCTVTHETHDRGNYIEELTIVDVGRQRADEREAKEHDDCLANCGPAGMACAIVLIPEGYKKVFEIFNSIRN